MEQELVQKTKFNVLSLKLSPTQPSLLTETGKASTCRTEECLREGGGEANDNDNKKRCRLYFILFMGDTIGVDRARG
jgi:hypothetical protein